MREHQHAALREHHVVVQFLRQALPELDRVVVDSSALVVKIVRADDRGVAAGVAAAEPPLLEHGDIRDAVDGRQIVRGRQTVAAGTDDDDVVCGLRSGVTPLARPAPLAVESLRYEARKRETPHAPITSTNDDSMRGEGWNVAD